MRGLRGDFILASGEMVSLFNNLHFFERGYAGFRSPLQARLICKKVIFVFVLHNGMLGDNQTF